ncbi:hypothetical protein KVG95_23920 [Pseudomonas sp. SWRI79]|uniref:Uncharacterized protein n=1 Tax=Pseudomonas farris TaxID=2841207 RepID=A0ABS6Q1I3_9PSED|nr:hypothetical protein [Pseudomonas farris]MBV4466369.1 hypothetical protein [Pseudomonas farris]
MWLSIPRRVAKWQYRLSFLKTHQESSITQFEQQKNQETRFKKSRSLPEKNQGKTPKNGGTNGGAEGFIKTITYYFSNTYIDKKLTTSRLFNA